MQEVNDWINRPMLELALDELIANRRGADLQRLALPLARELCPGLVANELTKDGGEDAFLASALTLFPKMVTAFAPGYIFLFFCFMMVLQLIWVRSMVIETKVVPLEQVQQRLGVTC
jgi:hypothetical protein